MSGDSHKDKLDRGPAPSGAPAAATPKTTLPAREPGSGTPEEQRRDLVESLEALEGQFRFMGKGHPDYATTQRRIEELRMMIERLDRLLG